MYRHTYVYVIVVVCIQ